MKKNKDDKEFTLEHQYQLYLSRMALVEDKMHPVQRLQLRQTFYGAVGQILILLKEDISQFEEDEAIEILQAMLNQVGDFFLADSKN
jgi:hypothetical protein